MLGRPLLERGEDRAAVVVDDHDGQVGPRLARPDHQPVAVVQEGDVAEQRQRPGAVRPAEGRADGGRHRCRRCRRARGWPPPCGGPPRGYGATIRSRSRTGLEAPTKSRPPGGTAALTAPATCCGVSRPRAASSPSSRRRDVGVAALPLVEPGPSSRSARISVGLLAGEPPAARPRSRPGPRPGGRVPRVGPAGRAADGDDLEVVAGQQPGHRPRQRRVPEDHDLLDPAGELVVAEQQPVGADHVVAGARAAGGLGEQRPAGPLGEHPRGRPRVVAGHHHRARAGAERRRLGHGWSPGTHPAVALEAAVERAAPTRRRRRGRAAPRTAGSGAPARAVRRATRAAAAARAAIAARRPPAASRPRRCRGAPRQVGVVPDGAAEDPRLVGGLVGAGAAEPGRPVGGDDQQRQAGVRGLEDGRVQVGHRGAAGGDHRHRSRDAWRGRARGSRPSARRSGCAAEPPGRAASRRERRAARPGPGASTTSADAARTSASTTARRSGGRAVRGRSCRTRDLGQPRRSRQCAARSPGARIRSSGAASTPGAYDGQHAVDRQQRVGGDVAGEQLHGRQPAGVAAARAGRPPARRPAAIPTLVSRALQTTTGSPMSSAIRRQARTPPSGCTLSTAMSAASRSRTR